MRLGHVVHDDALATDQPVQTPIAEASALGGQLAHASAHRGIFRSPGPVADRRPIDGKHSTRPALAHPVRRTEMRHGLAPGGGRHHFFAATSFNIALSSIASANSFFSRAFSSSSAFSRRASETSSPPYLAFHL